MHTVEASQRRWGPGVRILSGGGLMLVSSIFSASYARFAGLAKPTERIFIKCWPVIDLTPACYLSMMKKDCSPSVFAASAVAAVLDR